MSKSMGNNLFSKKEEEAVESTVKSTILEESKTEKVQVVDSSTKPEDDKKDESEIDDSSTKPKDDERDESIAKNDNESAAKKEHNIQIKESGKKDLKLNANEEEIAKKEEETAKKDAEDPNQLKDETEPVTISKTSESLKKNDVVKEKSNDLNSDGNEDLTKQPEKPTDEDVVMTEEQNETKATTDGTSNGEAVTAGVKRKDSPVTTNNVDATIDGKIKRAKLNKDEDIERANDIESSSSKVKKDEDKIDEDIEKANDIESSSSKDAVVA